ncbi:nucleotidyltransferase domain-containing protein [Candidatus Nitrosacidococcus sp. I8]|uniref:nucleotidyltransferase domain-containing protein n=1 Tax=Candidatus Nitrosacidococcus sp. I8 TaxID=2942908 RepID=UPI0022275742|nr:nucleotidyltransferase domain-containing protein [Candidatus Nitrosacidococcus sp. I8]CAH9018337.1 hypothetical protein NURINAE_00867 [Candidatus Nitrosacidococcus sp. I8]
MRLQPKEISAIKQAVEAVIGSDAKVYLFGSRTDDTQLGGDIDLLVEVNRMADSSTRLDHRIKLKTQLYQLIGEQKIDLVINYTNTPETAFQKSIKKNALLL